MGGKLGIHSLQQFEPCLFNQILTQEVQKYSLYFIYMQYKKPQAHLETESGSTIFEIILTFLAICSSDP